jgi:hypothetical protein
MTRPKDDQSITQEHVRSVFNYDPETGIVTRINELTTPNRHLVGPNVGSRVHGHLRVFVGGRNVFMHRVIWLWMTGSWPSQTIDHINGIRDDNRWINLRDVSVQENSMNRRVAAKTSRSGIVGVHWDKAKRRYRAKIGINGVTRYLGTFTDISDAQSARQRAFEENAKL